MKQLHKFLRLINSDHNLLRRIYFSYYCSLWFWWVVANVGSGALREFFPWITPLFGFFQWLVLRKYSRHLGWWVIVSAYTWIATYFITILSGVVTKISEVVPKGELVVIGVSVNMQVLWTYILVALLGSSVIGVCQWLVMRNHIQYADWWILASSMGGVARGFVSAVLQSVVDPMVAQIAGWFGYAAVTGIALVWLLKTRIKRRLEREVYLI